LDARGGDRKRIAQKEGKEKTRAKKTVHEGNGSTSLATTKKEDQGCAFSTVKGYSERLGSVLGEWAFGVEIAIGAGGGGRAMRQGVGLNGGEGGSKAPLNSSYREGGKTGLHTPGGSTLFTHPRDRGEKNFFEQKKKGGKDTS